MEGKARRQSQPRSRSGCITCKQRHVRCDEKRPFCGNCLTGRRLCKYTPAEVPLRERRARSKALVLPGEQQPWTTSTQLPPVVAGTGTASDPFETLPIQMNLKSRELFHYFHQVGEAFGVLPKERKEDCMALAVGDPHALRNTLVLAGLHYSWNFGKLGDFESTFLFHKLEVMRIVKKWIDEPRSKKIDMVCIRQISTLCLAECCLGNIATAETHLRGLMALLRSRNPPRNTTPGIIDMDDELADRYMTLVYNFLHGLRGRASDSVEGILGASPANFATWMTAYHKREPGGLENRLIALRKFPYFFSSPPSGRQPREVDVRPMINCMKDITTAVDRRRKAPRPTAGPGGDRAGGPSPMDLWMDGAPTRLLLAFVDCHVRSLAYPALLGRFSREPVTAPGADVPVFSSWSSAAAVTGIYMHDVLGLWNSGLPTANKPRDQVILVVLGAWKGKQPIDCGILRQVLQILKKNVERDKSVGDIRREEGAHGLGQDYWFWKVFIGAFGLARGLRDSSGDMPEGYYGDSLGDDGTSSTGDPARREVQEMAPWFESRVREWSSLTNVRRWSDAKAALRRITWPEEFDEELGEGVWVAATSHQGAQYGSVDVLDD